MFYRFTSQIYLSVDKTYLFQHLILYHHINNKLHKKPDQSQDKQDFFINYF